MAEGAENNTQEENVNNEAVVQTEENTQHQVTDNNPEPGSDDNQHPSFDEQLKAWAKQNGREIENVNDLLKPVEVEKEITKEVNPYDSILDDEDKAYLEYKKETGRGRKDYEALKQDWDKAPSLELARERVRRETSASNLTDAQIDEYLQEELGIDIEEGGVRTDIKLASFAKPIRDEKKAEQEKYRKPVENKQPETTAAKQEYVTLPDGAVMRKADYEARVASVQKFKEEAKEAVKAVVPATFKISVDENGSVRELNYSYEYGEQDMQEMVSIVSDTDSVIKKRYETEQGFNHKSFAEDMLWSDPKFREKAISDLANKTRAEAIEETMKLVGNHNYKTAEPLPKQTREGVKVVPVNEAFNFKR